MRCSVGSLGMTDRHGVSWEGWRSLGSFLDGWVALDCGGNKHSKINISCHDDSNHVWSTTEVVMGKTVLYTIHFEYR